MKRKSKDGIIFDNIVYLSEEDNKRFPVYMRLLQLLSVLTGSYYFMAVLIRSFNLQVISRFLIGAVIFTGCAFFFFIIFPAYGYIKFVFTFAIYGGMFYFLYDHIKNGFFLFENAVIEKASSYYGFPEFRYLADYSNADRDITLLLIMFLIPVSGVFTLSLLRSKLNWICYLIMIIPVVGSFAIGVTPSEIHLISYILVLLFLSISNGQFKVADYSNNNVNKVQKSLIYRINIRSALVVCILSLIVFFIIKLFFPVDKYNSHNEIKEAKANIQNFMMEFSLSDVSDKLSDLKWRFSSGRKTSSGGLSQGELGRVDQVVYDETEHLRITVPAKSAMEGIYLKGYVASIYTGDRWKTHNQETREKYATMIANIPQDVFEPAIGNSIFLNLSPFSSFLNRGRIGITYIKANKNYVYTPYFVNLKDKEGFNFEYDLAIVPTREIKTSNYEYFYNLLELLQEEYIISDSGIVLKDTQINTFLDFIKYEKQYRNFVYETYTKLPEKGLERLKADFSRETVGKEAENLADAISYIKGYLNKNTRYSLSPGKLPKGKDFVEYFLYENKIGYCTHFASAGALMLRAMGYPARYVEGYAVSQSELEDISSLYSDGSESSDLVEISVKDYNAHAWVEVYFDRFGWIPVEFTSVSGMDDLSYVITEANRYIPREKNEITTPTPKPTNAPQASPTEIPQNEEESPTQAPSKQDGNERASGDKTKGAYDKSQERWFLTTIWLIISAGSIILYILKISKRYKRSVNENYNRKALRIFEDTERLFVITHMLPRESKSLEDNEEYVIKNCTLISSMEFEEFMSIVKKARFGREPISFIEYTTVQNFYIKLYKQVYENLSVIRKLFLKIKSIKC